MRADLNFHRRVREGFLKQAEADPTWVTLDATVSAAELQGLVRRTVQPYVQPLTVHTRSPRAVP